MIEVRQPEPRRRKESQIIDLLFSSRKIDELSDYLDQHPDLDLVSLTDAQNNTILHQLAYEGQLDIMRLFVSRAKRFLSKRGGKKKLYERDENQEITVWMNLQNSQGFTALLYACYNGHMDVIRYLTEDFRVNEQLTTNTGLNLLHLAAQTNMVLPLVYFKDRIGINQCDHNSSSTLHWASYMGSEEVVSYLLACEELTTLNSRDNEGNTPLMMAVNYGNTRIVRKLLIKGADRYLRNNSNLSPLQVARENEYKTIGKMLNQEFSCCDLVKFYCNIKVQYKPKHRNFSIPIVFLASFVLNISVFNLIIEFTHQYGLAAEIAVFSIMLLLYLSLLKGPKKGGDRKNLDELLVGGEKGVKGYCFDCKAAVPKRGYHCQVCKLCITQYDHHCTWINNCVGKRNIGRFIFFLFFLILCLGLLGLIAFLEGLGLLLSQSTLYDYWFILRSPFDEPRNEAITICLLAVNFGTSLFVVPLLALFVVQIKNLLKNKTTYETYRSPPESPNEMKDRIRKYDSRVSFRNCKVMCSDSYSSFTSSATSKGEVMTGRSFTREAEKS